MSYKKHPQPIDRIVEIVKRLYAFERLKVSAVALEYGVSDKTIRRDLQKIAKHLPLLSWRGIYQLDKAELSKLQRLPSELLHAFASNIGLQIECLGGSQSSIPLISFAIAYNGISKEVAEEIIKSIDSGNKCAFTYTNNKNERKERSVSPIRLYTERGKWYLIAKDDLRGDIRTFDFLKIRNFRVLSDEKAVLSESEIKEAAKRSSVWASSNNLPFEVKLYAKEYARRYLDEVPLHRSQTLEEIHSDGGAIYTYTITHPMELLPEIKTWIPHLFILSPATLKEQLHNDLHTYQNEIIEMDI